MIKATIVKEDFKNGKYNELLKDIYVDESLIDYQQTRYIKAIEKYISSQSITSPILVIVLKSNGVPLTSLYLPVGKPSESIQAYLLL